MHTRIKLLRKALGLTQQEFAERIGVKQNAISQYEIGRNEPIDAVLSLICREFNVNPVWLRKGTGDMFLTVTRTDEIASYVGRILKDDSAEFQRSLILLMSQLPPELWTVLEDKACEILGRTDKSED